MFDLNFLFTKFVNKYTNESHNNRKGPTVFTTYEYIIEPFESRNTMKDNDKYFIGILTGIRDNKPSWKLTLLHFSYNFYTIKLKSKILI